MRSITLFCEILRVSYKELLKNFWTYMPSYMAFFIVDLISCIPLDAFGYGEDSFYKIALTLIVGVLSLIVVVNVVMIEKSKVMFLPKEPLLYTAPTYLIYTLYVSLAILAGVFCFVIPGIIIAVLLGMAPLASVLIDNDSVNYFKISYRMARLDPVLIICFGFMSLLIELPSFAFDLIPDWGVKLGFNILYSFFDSAVLVVLTIASVRIFYHLKSEFKEL